MVQRIAALPGMEQASFDWCAYGQRKPDDGLLIRKPTTLLGNAPVPFMLSRRCTRDHLHGTLQGGFRLDGKWVNATEWAGGYNRAFAKAARHAHADEAWKLSISTDAGRRKCAASHVS